jgi:diguanylate cyclase (GGDEF)-like protein/PAS domain S-box-containing protein
MGAGGGAIGLERLLEVVAEFMPFGGLSLGLLAWELGVEKDAVRDAWARAEELGLFEPAGIDRSTGERLVALSALGERAVLAAGSVHPLRAAESSQPQGDVPNASLVESLSALAHGAPVALVRWEGSGRVLAWNRAAEQIFGWPAAAVVGGACPILANAGSESGVMVAESVLAGGRFEDEEINVRRGDGTLVDISLSTRAFWGEGDVVESVIGAAMEITERRRRMRQLRHLASHDPLTDLHNRRAFRESLERVLERVRRGGPPGALLMLDLDRLKTVNDRLGHPVGDAVLVAVANVLRGLVRPGDLIARVGGDEFAVVLERVATAEAALIAERFRATIAEQRIGREGRGRSTVSIGGTAIDGTLDGPDLLACVDGAMYLAKRQGDRVEIIAPRDAIEADLGKHDRDDDRLRDAIALNDLAVHYQGVIDLQSGTVHSEEALARIRLGGVFQAAADFVALAERTGLIAEIDTRVTRIVIDQLAERPDQRLSINLSGASLEHLPLLELMRERAPAGGFAGRLIAEIRQPDLLADPSRATRFAQHAHSVGAAIAVDDLGAGESTLAAFQSLPITLVKLDRRHARNLTDPASRERVRETVHACADAGITLVAKGIEEAATLESLLSLGVTHGEGFLLDEPHLANASGAARRGRSDHERE